MSNAIPKLTNRAIKKYKFPINEHYGILSMDKGLQLISKKRKIGQITVTAIVDVYPIPKLAKIMKRAGEEVTNLNKVCYRYSVRKNKELLEANAHTDFEFIRERMQYFGVVA